MAGIICSHSPWDYDGGAKLMEHAYIGEGVVEAVMQQIAENPARVVWAGDYADEEPGHGDKNLYGIASGKPNGHITGGDGYGSDRYLINLDRREYVDLHAAPAIKDWAGHYISPLALLTCEGNGRGGGDFRGDNPLVGAWSRDLLTAAPKGWDDGADWTEVTPNFYEH